MKPTYRSSSLGHYVSCPYKYYLSTQYEMKTTSPMKDGLLFEGLFFGFKDKEHENEAKGTRYKKDGEPYKVLDVTLLKWDAMEKKAKKIYDTLKLEGEAFHRFDIEFPEYKLRGEADFIGEITYKGKRFKCLLDLKYTGDIERNWNYRNSKYEFLQACMYNTLWILENKGKEVKPLPFIYLVVENNDFQEPMFKVIYVEVTNADCEWMMSIIDKIHTARKLEYQAKPSEDKCLGKGAYASRCQYFQYCKHGRKLVDFDYKVIFGELNND
jgi:hypothetical protein